MEAQRKWSFDWRKSPPHLALLITFLTPRLPGEHPAGVDWVLMLGESPDSAVERFFVQGAVARIYPAREILEQFTVIELRRILRAAGQKVSGEKVDLVTRILDAQIQLVKCSPYGQQFAERYLANPQIQPEVGLTTKTLKKVLLWLSEATTAGVVGNAVYDAIKRLLVDMEETPAEPKKQEEEEEPLSDETNSLVSPRPNQDVLRTPLNSASPPLPNDPPTPFKVSQTYYYQGIRLKGERDYKGAIELLSKAIAIYPLKDYYLSRASTYLILHDYRQAIKDYNQIIRLFPHIIDGYALRADAYTKMGWHRQAIDDFSHVIKLDSQFAAPYSDRAAAYLKLGRHRQAIDDYEQAIKLEPQRGGLYTSRGHVWEAVKDYRKAVADYKKAIQLGDKSARNSLKNVEQKIREQERKEQQRKEKERKRRSKSRR